MGMNYYCEVGMKNVVCEYGCHHSVPDILHIGKNSYGWAFLLQGYDDENHKIKSFADWKKILKSAKRIYNEDGNDVSYEEMIGIILKKSVVRTNSEMKKLQKSADEITYSNFSEAKCIIRNGLLVIEEYLKQSDAKEDENFAINYEDFI